MVLITQPSPGADDLVRPASAAEVELWNALARRFASPVRESYIRVNEQDLVSALMEKDHLRRQIAELQQKMNELQQKLLERQDEKHVQAEETKDEVDGARASVKRGTVPL